MICLNGLVQAQTISLPLRASEQEDSITVAVPISIIKKANERLIQRKYLISIYYEQDSIIRYKDDYILYQEDIINDMQNKIVNCNQLNEELNQSLEKQKKTNKVIIYSGVGVAAGLLIGVLFK